jgi:hypothetical protein
MLIHPAMANANTVGIRIIGAVGGTLLLLLGLLALVRPEMTSMTTLHMLMSAAGL